MKKYIFLAALALIAMAACGGKKSQTPAVGNQVGNKFVDFEVVQPDGSVAKLSDYAGKGKYVLVDFWASWCGPCKEEIPYIRSVYKKYAGKKFDVVSVAVWDNPEETVAAASEHGVTWNQILNAGKIPSKLYGIEAIPLLILINPDGVIVERGGSLRNAKIYKTLEKYLK